MSGELVSIVLPTYNRRELLQDAVASIQTQTYADWELIVVDDGSTDASLDGLPRDGRIRVVQRPHTGNLAAVRSAGLAKARGSLIAFQDSDDLWHPDKLAAKTARLARRPDCGWCYGRHRLVNEQGSEIERRYGFPWQPREGSFVREMISQEADVSLQTVVVRQKLAVSVGFDERVPFGDDYDFVVRLAIASPACVVDDVVADVREHPGRSSRQRHDMPLWMGLSYHRYERLVEDRELKRLCRRQAVRSIREYLARARNRGQFMTGVGTAAAAWWRSG